MAKADPELERGKVSFHSAVRTASNKKLLIWSAVCTKVPFIKVCLRLEVFLREAQLPTIVRYTTAEPGFTNDSTNSRVQYFQFSFSTLIASNNLPLTFPSLSERGSQDAVTDVGLPDTGQTSKFSGALAGAVKHLIIFRKTAVKVGSNGYIICHVPPVSFPLAPPTPNQHSKNLNVTILKR